MAKNSSGRRRATKRARGRPAKDIDMNEPTASTVMFSRPPTWSRIPEDIFLVLFPLLDPLGLANLAQTNQMFRRLLTTGIAPGIWRKSRDKAWGAPECPPKMSEISWARLLFGAPQCQACGTRNVHKIDFALRRRLCNKCKQKNLINLKHVVKKLGCDSVMLELVPYTHYGPRTGNQVNLESKYYWVGDIRAIMHKYEQLQADIAARKHGAEDVLQQFWNHRVQYVQSCIEHAHLCHQWWGKVGSDQHGLTYTRRQKYYDEIVHRFQAMGYEDQDIRAIDDHPDVKGRESMTPRIWDKIGPTLQETIEVARCARLDEEQAALVIARKDIIQHAYDAYKRTIRPIECVRLPPLDLLYATPTIRALVYDHLEAPLQQAIYDTILAELPVSVALVHDRLQAYMLGFMNDKEDYEPPAQYIKRASANQEHHLSLATSVFTFAGRFMCSIEETLASLAYYDFYNVVAHQQTVFIDFWRQLNFVQRQHSTGWSSTSDWRLIYCSGGRFAVVNLIEELGLDPETTTSEDLDKLDWRFVCTHCESEKDSHNCPRDYAYSWRMTIPHFYRNRGHLWTTTSWRALSKEECDIVRRAEGGDPSFAQPMWSCNHCTTHLSNLQTRSVVLEHVQEVHAIQEPQYNIDMFHAYPPARTLPTPLSLSSCISRARKHSVGHGRR